VTTLAELVLVVDDEKPIADILKYNLEREGFRVAVAYDGTEALAATERDAPDLIVLDIMLPGLDGLAVCRRLRTYSRVPILMLTARGEEQDKVRGLELGADDYVTKPFSPREVIARVKALLRRSQGVLAPSGAPLRSVHYGRLAVYLENREVTRDGRPVDLTIREFELLKYLATRPGQVFTRENLLHDVWGYEFFGDSRVVDVTIRRLREKIEDDPGDPAFIQTKRGVGYFFHDPAAAGADAGVEE
jgi:two-component system response regulator VicR